MYVYVCTCTLCTCTYICTCTCIHKAATYLVCHVHVMGFGKKFFLSTLFMYRLGTSCSGILSGMICVVQWRTTFYVCTHVLAAMGRHSYIRLAVIKSNLDMSCAV